MPEELSFYQQVQQAGGYGDVLGVFNLAFNEAAGETWGDADSIFSLNDNILGVLSEIINTIESSSNSGLFATAGNEFGSLNSLHAAAQALISLEDFLKLLDEATDAGELTGGLALVGNTAGEAQLLLSAASGALAVFGAVVAPEAAAIAIASVTLGALANTLGAIQQAAGDFNNLVATIQNAIDEANRTGEPVVIEPDNGRNDSNDGNGNQDSGPDGDGVSGNDPGRAPIEPGEPIIISPDTEWEDLELTNEQREQLEQEPTSPAPPPADPDRDDQDDDRGRSNNNNNGGRRRSEEEEDLQRLLQPKTPGPDEPRGTPPSGPSMPNPVEPVPRDPLVLDLDGDGIELTQASEVPVFFDANGDGVAALTGWVDPDDGLLARDVDGNGLIETQAELFGTATVDAISDLATQDDDGNGVIDASDTVWDSLRLWRDLNQDGVSSANELQTLDEAGIRSISVASTPVGEMRGENFVHSSTIYETTAGDIGQAAAVFFGVNTLISQTEPPIVFEQGSAYLDIPNTKGFGHMLDLRSAAYHDPELFTMAQSLMADAAGLTGTEFQLRFEALALRWAGVHDLPGADAQQQRVAFLDAFRGAETPGEDNGTVTTGHYHTLIDSLALRFAIEMASIQAGQATTPEEVIDFIDSPFFALTYADVSPTYGLLDGNLERVIYEIGTRLPEDTGAAMAKLEKIMPLLSAFRNEYFAEAEQFFRASQINSDFNDYVRSALARHIDNPTLVEFAFAAVNASSGFVGTAGDDTGTLDIAAYETFYGRTALVDLGQGSDSLVVTAAQAQSDHWDVSYVYAAGDGIDSVDVSAAPGMHRLFLSGIDAAQVAATVQSNGRDILVEFANGGSILFAGINDLGFEFEILTDDGQTIVPAVDDRMGVFLNTDDDQTHVGNELRADAYHYGTGGGVDSIEEIYTAGDETLDRLIFADINRDDLILTVELNDLVLTFANGQPGDSLRIINQTAAHGFGSDNSAYKVEEFEFANGEVITAQELIDDYFAARATPGDDVITGFRFADTLHLSDGTDSLHGERSGDLYIRGAGVTGTTTIEDNGSSVGDRLVVQGFTQSEATFAQDVNHLVVTLPNGTVIIRNQFGINTSDVIETLQFDDGELSATEITALTNPVSGSFVSLTGTEDADVLTGGNDNEIIDGAGGDDVLNGRGGSDIYVFGNNSGNDIIDESGHAGSASVDRVQLLDVTPGDVSLQRDGVDLIVTVVATGQTLTIDQQFQSANQGVEYFEFADGSIWDAAQIARNSIVFGAIGDDTLSGSSGNEVFDGLAGNDSLRGSTGDDTYVFRPGDGHDTINDARYGNDETVVNTVRLLDTTLADLRVEFVNDNGSISDIRLSYGVDDSVLLLNAAWGAQFANSRPIQRVELSDGTVLNDQELIDMAVVYGTEGNDTMTGATRIDGLGGDDVLTGFGENADFYWRAGSGNDLIINSDFDGGSGRLLLEGLNRADVIFGRDGLDLLITNPVTSETVRVQNQFQPVQNGLKAGLSGFVFADETLDRNAVANASLAPTTDGADQIIGGYDQEILIGGLGADTMDGGQGSDAYIWHKGDGHDHVIDDSNGIASIDVLYLMDVAPGEITLSRVDGTSTDLLITIPETGETISIHNQLGYGSDGLEWIQFSDGTRQSLVDIERDLAFVDVNGTGFVEGDYLDNTLQGLAGDDLLNGGEGADVYVWTRGDGNDRIAETRVEFVWGGGDEGDLLLIGEGEGELVEIGEGEGDLIEIGEGEESFVEVEVPEESDRDVLQLVGVRSTEVTFARQTGTDDLLITITDTGEVITVVDHFHSALAGIERIAFEDSLFGRADIFNQLSGENLVGDGSDQTLIGTASGDHFQLSAGNETVVTGGGQDVIYIGENGGFDRIEGFVRGVNGTEVALDVPGFGSFDAILAAGSDTPDGVLINLGGGNQLLIVDTLLSDLECERRSNTRPR
ncbi:calcium-binding protein [Phaeobacter sp. PT47_59]|uniref:calcium-binding protein n=1 Tax=Phaeobacter sp. PT47_59 TaxID=3029979 RepID=UPI0023800BC9|nr:calcium-binding protein [Phaeobacter sp. PT47_59]MDE4176264.1 calcium-binding protein [Phaeobacter sp. PT47_59]